MKKNISGIILSLITFSVLAQPITWENKGICGGGATFSPSVSPHNDNLYYITSDMGGIFKSENAGKEFNVLPYYEIISKGAHSKVFFTSNPKVLYSFGYTTYPNPYEPIKSMDGGKTWEVLGEDPTNGETFHIFVDPHREDRLLVLNYTTAYFSNDGGETFTPAFEGDVTIYIGGVFWDDTNIYIGTNQGLYISHDDGQTFNQEGVNGDFPPNDKIRSMAGKKVGGQVTLYAISKPDLWAGYSPTNYWAPDSKILRLNYGNGNTWEDIGNGLSLASNGGSFHPNLILTNEENPNIIYLGGYDAPGMEIYKSIDEGDNWQVIFDAENTNSNPNIETGWLGAGSDFNWWWSGPVIGMEVALHNSDIVIITDYMSTHQTRDGGNSWQALYTKPSELNPADQDTPQHSYYSSNGLEVTSSWWLTWITEDDIFASYTDIQGFISHNKGESWSSGYGYPKNYNTTYKMVKHPSNGKLYAVVCSKHDIYESVYLTDDLLDDGEGEIYESNDNGISWTSTYDFDRTIVDLAIDPNNDNRFYASIINSVDGGIYYSDNYGSTWVHLPNPPRTEGHPKAVKILDDGTLVSVFSARYFNGFTQSSGVFVSNDNGETWEDRSDNEMLYWTKDVEISSNNNDVWYASVFSHWGAGNNEQGGLFRTLDRGLTWENIADFYRVRSMTIHPSNPDIAYICTADNNNGLQYTENLSSTTPTFIRLDDYHFHNPQRVFFNPYDENEIWVTSFGNGIKKGTVQDEPTANFDIELSQQITIYPNPSNHSFKIDLGKTYSKVNITINNLEGKIIEKKIIQDASVFDIELIQQGIYFIRIENEEEFEVRKLIRI